MEHQNKTIEWYTFITITSNWYKMIGYKTKRDFSNQYQGLNCE